MTPYLVKSPRHLVQLLACNILNRGYLFYCTSWIPDGKDPLPIDARLLLIYSAHLPKEKQYRRRKAGLASVRYLRCGQLCVLLATKGQSPFFEREAWKDVREVPLHIAGYSLRVAKDTGKVSVRIHAEAQRKMRREMTEKAAWDVRYWEERILNIPFLAFSGVRDNVFALVRHLNACRKSLRKPPVEWKRCVRKRIKPEPVFLPTPPEVDEAVKWYGGEVGRARRNLE
jgi:hypothetical protein